MTASHESEASLLEALAFHALERRTYVKEWFVGCGDGQDISEDLLAKLNGSGIAVFRKASEAVKDAQGFARDLASGSPAWLLRVYIKRWLSDSVAEVQYSQYRDPEAASGSKGTARWVDGHWTFEFLTHWMS